MPDTKITALAAITTVAPANDLFAIVDVSDNSMAASGTTKNITTNQILGAGGTATLASATITGDLTVDTSTLKVDSTNNRVGIGTATPAYPLHVSASDSEIVIQDSNTPVGSNPASLLSFWGSASRAGYIGYPSDNNLYINQVANSSILFLTNNTTQMTLNSTGLGIGTSSPIGRLEAVGGTGAGFNGWFRTGDATAANNAGGGFYNTSSATAASRSAAMALDADGANLGGGDYFIIQKNGNSGTVDIVQYSNAAMRFGTDYTNRAAFDMTLDASGNLLVGTTSLGARNTNIFSKSGGFALEVQQRVSGSAGSGLGITYSAASPNNATDYFLYCADSTTVRLYANSNGNVLNTNGSYGTISDLRLKENISDARNYLADLMKLRVVKYSLKSEASTVATKIGFIAQEVEQVFPTLVETNSDEVKSIKTTVLIPMLLKAIQELTARVQTLEAK